MEKWWEITLQIAISVIISGLGTIAVGVILGILEKMEAFQTVRVLVVLTAPLISTQSNLDMSLASRLCTRANLERFTCLKTSFVIVAYNIYFVQVQCIVIGFISGFFAIISTAIIENKINYSHSVFVLAISVSTSTLGCFTTDILAALIIIPAKRYNINPDNIATPLIATIGDIITMNYIYFITPALFENLETKFWINYFVIVLYVVLLPVFFCIVFFSDYKHHLKNGWVSNLVSLFISSLGSLVFNSAFQLYTGTIVFLPLINGSSGNMSTIQSSRISTRLYKVATLGTLPEDAKICQSPIYVLFDKNAPHSLTAKILIALSVPIQLVLLLITDVSNSKTITVGVGFTVLYLFLTTIQLVILLYIAHILNHALWKRKIDPDTSAIPYLSALGDFSGSCMLLFAFVFVTAIGEPYN